TCQRLQRRHQMRHETGPPDHGVVDKAGTYTQVLDHGHGPHAGRYAGGGQAVDVAHAQAGIGHCAMRCLHQNFHIGIAMSLAQARMPDAYDSCRTTQVGIHHAVTPACLNTTTLAPASLSSTLACTAMPIVTKSAEIPSTRDIMRTPSSRSMSATL